MSSSCAVAGGRDVAWVASGKPEQPRRLDVAEGRFDHFRGRVQPLEAAYHRSRLGEVALRHDERVGDRRLLQRLAAAQAVDGVDRRHHGLERVVMADDRLGEERVDDRRRVGQTGGLDHHAAKRRNLAALAPAQEIPQLVGQVAAQRAADAARTEEHRPLVHAS